MHRFRRYRADLLALLAILFLALLWFAPVLVPSVTGKTLLPYDNLATFAPWRSLNPSLIPHNNLLSDLVLENAVWKLHIRRTLAQGEAPLWNPQIFTGIPFLAAGQASTLYPLNILFYLLPLEAAYGWFTALQVALAGANLYLFARALRLRILPSLLGAVVMMFSGFLMVSVVFTMFLAAVPWLALLLAIIETVIRKQEEKGAANFQPIPYVAAGAGVLGLVVLAGHPELIYYTLIVAGLYAAARLLVAWRRIAQRKTPDADPAARTSRRVGPAILGVAAWLLALAVIGIALGAAQLLPLLELLPLNFRAGSASLAQVQEWAWPVRHVLTFFLPDVFGNPSHHHWFDIWQRTWVQTSVNALGEPVDTIFWGIKNYVEGGNYLGVAPWLLAGVAMWQSVSGLWRRRASAPATVAAAAHRVTVWFFAGLALISLLFAFGTPLYAILYYGLPGWNQLHSPFRWVFPFTVSMAVLASVGLELLLPQASAAHSERLRAWRRLSAARLLAIAALLAGVAALASVGLSLLRPEPFIAFGQAVVNGSDLAQMTFADGRMFWGYQALNLLRFGLAAAAGGVLLWLLGGSRRGAWRRWAAVGLILLTALDLYATLGRFNPASDITLSPLAAQNVPPVVHFVNAREGINEHAAFPPEPPTPPWRFTTFNMPGEKTFNANVGMYYGWSDIRGYDSIIPRQYVQLMERIQPQQNELLYNRIAPIYSQPGGDVYAGLDNPLLDLLNVKYVLTEHVIPNPTWHEVYRDDAIGVYENSELFPRAFIARTAQVVAAADQPLLSSDLRSTVFIEEAPADPNALTPASPQLADAHISRYTANELFVDLNLSDRAWLVLSDAYFPGWKAFVRPFGSDESQERELQILRADGALRAVYLPQDGQWTVRFVYSPMSFKLGLYVSFLSGMALLLLLVYWLWGRFYRPEHAAGEVRMVAKNSLAPMALSLINKAIDFAFAMLYVRLLGPEGTGKWYFVVALYGFFEIVSRYGLGTLLTRDVAEDKNRSSRYLTNVVALRTLLWLVSLPVLALVTLFYRTVGGAEVTVFGYRLFGAATVSVQNIGVQEVYAIGLLALAMLFANYADALSSMFYAFEKMEYPAGLTNAVALLKVTLGALVLLIGWGFVGLAASSLIVNILQVIWLYGLLRRTLFRPQWVWDWPLQKWMVRNSGALMINHLLATIFWRIDIWILRPLAGAASVGLYSIGLKYLDGLNIVPSVFTMAIFPLMSRYARREGESLLRAYVLSLRLLVLTSLPIAMLVTFLARPLVSIVGGAQYLDIPGVFDFFGRSIPYMGGADLAFRVIIWSIPIGFVNSVTQYVLIAVNRQNTLTRAFVIGVLFNIVGNLILIPRFGYVAAAITTILSEFSLFFPFYAMVKQSVGRVPWLAIFLRPALSTGAMGVVIWLVGMAGVNVWLAALVGAAAYLVALAGLGIFRDEELAILGRALPLGPLRRLLPFP